MRTSNIKHLHWRAGFGLNPAQWQTRQHWSITQAVEFLFDSAKQQELNQKRLFSQHKLLRLTGRSFR